MKLSQYAKKLGLNYRTVWNWFKTGKLKGTQLSTGTIIINEEDEKSSEIYIKKDKKNEESD